MLLDNELFDKVLELAKSNPRGRMHFDLRTSIEDQKGTWKDTSQRMLNVLTSKTNIPIHRHNDTSETVICLRGAVEEILYDDLGIIQDRIMLRYGSSCSAIQVPRGVYHTCRCIEEGSVIFEAKDRAYDPVTTEDFLNI